MKEEPSESPGAGSPADEFALDELLAELAAEDRPVLYIPNPGNAGDALIAHATRQALDRAGVRYEWVADHRRFDPGGRVVVYGGGGNLTPLYSDAETALRWASGRARRLILLPHTVQGHEDLLSGLGPETDLFCRERVSLAHVRGAVREARCHLADDMAFAVDVDATLAARPAAIASSRRFLRAVVDRLAPKPLRSRHAASNRKIRRAARLVRKPGPAGDVVSAFRTDAESRGAPVPDGNLDLSRLFAFGTRTPDLCHAGAWFLLRYLDRFAEVHTDRLHVAIGAAVLGKRVAFHPNSYFKNRAVYEFSMRERFPGVTWVEPGADRAHAPD